MISPLRTALAVAPFALILVAAAPAKAPPAKDAKPPPAQVEKPADKSGADDQKVSLAPLPASAKVGWAHAPYSDGNCAICHERKDPKNPGPITMKTNELCFSCHEEFADLMANRSSRHNPAKKSCTNCHNPHNSAEKKLLMTAVPKLCFGCHDTTEADVMKSKVKHEPVTTGRMCLNCHDPHASNTERLLLALPFDLCVKCHSKDDLKDPSGKVLTNIKALLDKQKQHHKPVAEKDCSACHIPHGGENFRLLVDAYPAEFYAPYDQKNYALCFECHNKEMVKEKETTTLTKFRDGVRNLHYVHVNKAERGRTCRACHEVHASNKPHQIRDAVPYGTKGWMLQVNYTQNENGGTCDKTCHSAKTYVNKGPAAVVVPKADANKK